MLVRGGEVRRDQVEDGFLVVRKVTTGSTNALAATMIFLNWWASGKKELQEPLVGFGVGIVPQECLDEGGIIQLLHRAISQYNRP